MQKAFYWFVFVMAFILQSCGEKAVQAEKITDNRGDTYLLANDVCYSIREGEAIAKRPYNAKAIVAVEFPSKIKYDGKVYPVTSIGRQSFMGCPNLAMVKMSSSITRLGSAAFAGCPKLTSITFSDSLKTIATQAFHRCTGLTSVVIPEGIE